ncbi:hydroxymethylglutaryl-CoA synthase 1 [Neocloeon triangulifer]|uniref:hydroxymethylglutaryl-CoA synthase 1 n=1 Tax=Neocloeon triangulifer TaxID=2078957 RepID=UPI00286F0163|nr:hydroxymethylglutaryl-CoA synthase 1 [Neocloeon triangulifer]
MSRPEGVGIIAIEAYFPSQFVDQTELEQFDGVSAGKYTVGLGQARMGFCTDREDVNSLCLTAVQRLMERNNISADRIGRLEVGTETILDKSKSVKTVLMQLFGDNTDIEGIDTTNACYGGTAALFNALAWVESSAWDGRLAIVVAADIAVYATGSARPTGGAGAMAMLVGPNASLVIESGLRASYMKHAYDFYKPDLNSEYPVVDGKLSIQCYLSALDHCYQLYCKKAQKKNPGSKVQLSSFDAILFHSPYCKLVQKSLARLLLNDYYLASDEEKSKFPPAFEAIKNVKLEETYFDRDVERLVLDNSKQLFEERTKPSLFLANQIGNMYTPSLYGGLVSLLISREAAQLTGNRVALFSYGSGLASSIYSLRISSDLAAVKKVVDSLKHVKPQLEARRKVAPEEFSATLDAKEKNHHKVPYVPEGPVDTLFPGTWYLVEVDDKYRRTYKRVPL